MEGREGIGFATMLFCRWEGRAALLLGSPPPPPRGVLGTEPAVNVTAAAPPPPPDADVALSTAMRAGGVVIVSAVGVELAEVGLTVVGPKVLLQCTCTAADGLLAKATAAPPPLPMAMVGTCGRCCWTADLLLLLWCPAEVANAASSALVGECERDSRPSPPLLLWSW